MNKLAKARRGSLLAQKPYIDSPRPMRLTYPKSKMIRGLMCSTLKLLLLLTPIQAQTCSQRVTDDNVDHSQQVSFVSVVCSSSGNNRTINIIVDYNDPGPPPSQIQIEYQCFQSEPLSSETNTILKSWSSKQPTHLAADVNVSSSTMCVATGCYTVDARAANEPIAWMYNMSCSFEAEESSADDTPSPTTAITSNSNHLTNIFEITSSASTSVHWPASMSVSSPTVAMPTMIPSEYITIVVVVVLIIFVIPVIISLVVVSLIARRRINSKIFITSELIADVPGSYYQDPETQSVRTVYCSLSSDDNDNTDKRDCTTVHQKLQISININSTSDILQHEDGLTVDSCLPDSPQRTNSPAHIQFTNADTSDSGYGGIDKSVSSMSTTLNPDYIQMSLLVQN